MMDYPETSGTSGNLPETSAAGIRQVFESFISVIFFFQNLETCRKPAEDPGTNPGSNIHVKTVAA